MHNQHYGQLVISVFVQLHFRFVVFSPHFAINRILFCCTFSLLRNNMECTAKAVTKSFLEVMIMCNNGSWGGNGCWWIIILILLLCCCGNGNSMSCGFSGNNCGCGCERDNCGCC